MSPQLKKLAPNEFICASSAGRDISFRFPGRIPLGFRGATYVAWYRVVGLLRDN